MKARFEGMQSSMTIPQVSVLSVDDWLMAERPSVAEAITTIARIREAGRFAGLAEAHLVAYVRDELGVDEFGDDPPELETDPTW